MHSSETETLAILS